MYSLVGTSPALPAMAAHKGKINGGTTQSELNSTLAGWSQEAAQDTLSVVRFFCDTRRRAHENSGNSRTEDTCTRGARAAADVIAAANRPFKGKGRKGGAKLKVPSKCSDYIHCEGQRRSTKPIEAVVFLDPQVKLPFLFSSTSVFLSSEGQGPRVRNT